MDDDSSGLMIPRKEMISPGMGGPSMDGDYPEELCPQKKGAMVGRGGLSTRMLSPLLEVAPPGVIIPLMGRMDLGESAPLGPVGGQEFSLGMKKRV